MLKTKGTTKCDLPSRSNTLKEIYFPKHFVLMETLYNEIRGKQASQMEVLSIEKYLKLTSKSSGPISEPMLKVIEYLETSFNDRRKTK